MTPTATSDPLQRMVTGTATPAAQVAPQGLRPDEWLGQCRRCDSEAVLTVVKTDGRWTLRQLFTSAWEQAGFDVTCRRCSGRWPAHLQGEAMSLSGWLEQTRGGGKPRPQAD